MIQLHELPPRWAQLSQAYKSLGLEPLDSFMMSRYQMNIGKGRSFLSTSTPNLSPEEKYKGIGATTWMIVRAILEVENHRNAVIVLPREEVEHARQMAIQWCRKLFHNQGIVLMDNLGYRRNGATLRLRCEGEHLQLGYDDALFKDSEWKERASRRIRGNPFEMIQVIHRDKSGRIQAYAEEHEKCLDLTEEALGPLLASRAIHFIDKLDRGHEQPAPTGSSLDPHLVTGSLLRNVKEVQEQKIDASFSDLIRRQTEDLEKKISSAGLALKGFSLGMSTPQATKTKGWFRPNGKPSRKPRA